MYLTVWVPAPADSHILWPFFCRWDNPSGHNFTNWLRNSRCLSALRACEDGAERKNSSRWWLFSDLELSSSDRCQDGSSSDTYGHIEPGLHPALFLLFRLKWIQVEESKGWERRKQAGERGEKEKEDENICACSNPNRIGWEPWHTWSSAIVESAFTIRSGAWHLEVISFCDYIWTAMLVGSLLTSKHRPRASLSC